MCAACSLGADNYEINSDFMRQGSLVSLGGQILLLHSAHSTTTAVVYAPRQSTNLTTDTTKTSATALQHTLAYKKADGVCGSPHRCCHSIRTRYLHQIPQHTCRAYAAAGGGSNACATY